MPAWKNTFPDLLAIIDSTQQAEHSKETPGIVALFESLVQARKEGTLNAMVDVLLFSIDEIVSQQINAILHHPSFQNLERAWRSLYYLVERVDFSQNIRLEFMNLSKSDLLMDFEDSPEITRSGFFKHVYTAEYGQYGGKPFGAIIADYEFSASKPDMELLQQASRVAAMAHVPFIAAAGRAFFGVEEWDELAAIESLGPIFDLPRYIEWKKFRKKDIARYAVLTLPPFLLRAPYGSHENPTKSFAFAEDAESFDDLCWGSGAFFLGVRMADSFADYRWCINLTGTRTEDDGSPFPSYDFASTRNIQSRIPTGLIISEKREHELSEHGFMSLVLRKEAGDAAFFSTTSCYDPGRSFLAASTDRDAELGQMLSAQLSYMMIANRLAHYIKVIQRDNLGLWRNEKIIEQELNKWISLYVTEMDDPDPVTRSRRPLREAKLKVSAVKESPEWYSVSMQIKPHFKYLGANFTLSLMSRLEV